MDFKFFKTKKNSYVWTDDKHYKIVFEKPQVQAFDEYVLLHDEKSILYYYYTLTIYKKHECFTQNKWKVFNTVTTHDFPAIRELKYILEYLLHDKDITKNYQRYTCENSPNGNGKPICVFSKTLGTGSHIAYLDDIYELTKYYDTRYKKFTYDFSVGVRDELLKISNLNTDDIYTLYTCVKSFIEYSIAIHNDNVTLHSKSYSIADGHIYQHFVDCYNYTISERIQEIFTTGDTFKRLTICEGGIVAKQSTDLYDVTILSVQEDSLKVTGTLEGGKISTKVVTPQELGYTYKHPNDSYRSYTATQIESHLLENLNSPEKLDFLTLPLEELFEKYHYYIMECYSMYSSEHHFLDDFGSGFLITKEHTEVIHKIVREIITNVKGSLLERI